MPYAVLSGFSPVRERRTPQRPAIVVGFEGTKAEQRGSLAGRTFYDFVLSYRPTVANMAVLDAFFVARGQQRDAFFWKPTRARHHARVAIPGLTPASDGVLTTFTLPTTGEYAGDYPINDTNVRLYRNGVLVGGTHSANPDDRTITSSVAPSAGGTLTASYHRYALVRLDGEFSEEEAVAEFNVVDGLTFREVTS